MSNTVRVSDSQKSRLDDLKEELFNTTDVPYRAVIGALIDEHDNNS